MNLTEIKENYVTELRNNPNVNSDSTINSYLASVTKFYKENNRIYRMTKQDLKVYMSNFRKRYSDSYYNVMGSSIKILFDKVFNQPNKMNWFETIKTEPKFVNIISYNKFVSMMQSTNQIKHKLIIILFYSTGIRLSELLNIKLTEIDWLNDRIFINTLKNGKNRYVQLHELTRRYLISYLKKWHPTVYLFEYKSGIKYSGSSVEKIVKRASNGDCYPHLLRHTYLTNVIEQEDVFAAKELAGHRSLRSTLHYNHIAPDRLKTMYNPLDCVIN